MTPEQGKKEASSHHTDASFSGENIKTKIILVTGMSGAGKSFALKTLEDIGYEAIDNIPLTILPLLVNAEDKSNRQMAIGIDIRNRDFSIRRFEDKILLLHNRADLEVEIIFMDCSDEVLQRRFNETRRRHPVDSEKRVLESIRHEREIIGVLHDYADYVVDSSTMSLPELRRWIKSNFAVCGTSLSIMVRSFSYKKGVPREVDIVFDTRFLRNPHYDPALQPLTGKDKKIAEYIAQDPSFESFFENLKAMIIPLLPRYLDEGKSYLTIGFGCTGGRHRSVFVSEKFTAFLKELGFKAIIEHRDLYSG